MEEESEDQNEVEDDEVDVAERWRVEEGMSFEEERLGI